MGTVHYEQQFSCGKTLLRHLYHQDGGEHSGACEGGEEGEETTNYTVYIDFTMNGKVALYCIK